MSEKCEFFKLTKLACLVSNTYEFHKCIADTPGSMALPGSPFYTPQTNPNLPRYGPERYICRFTTTNQVPNAVSCLYCKELVL